MIQATELNDRERFLNRQLRAFDRRLKRLEDQMNARFNRLENSLVELRFELNGKFDAIIQCLTGFNNI
jgi:flagellar capping protein FliD